MLIQSRTNERVKFVRQLRDAGARRETGLHIAEGNKLVWEAADAALVDAVFVLEGHETDAPPCACLTSVTAPVMEAMAQTRTPQTLLAVARTPDTRCPDAYPDGFMVVLDRLQDPGNVGAIIRSADALGAAGVLLSSDSADPFCSKALRASMGSSYHLPLYVGTVEQELARLKAAEFALVCGHLAGEPALPPMRTRTALVIGNEGAGVSDRIAEQCFCYRMPMRGRAESLNAAVFASLMMDRLLSRR